MKLLENLQFRIDEAIEKANHLKPDEYVAHSADFMQLKEQICFYNELCEYWKNKSHDTHQRQSAFQ